ncbi:MAG: hypothetical protein R2834_20410 [Rhodothermales bacterium]
MDTSALEGLRTQLIALHDRFSQAAHVYQQAADVFRQGLLPSIPPELEIRELGSVREKTLAVLSEAGYRVGLEPLPYDGSLTLADAYLDRIIQAIQAQEKKHRLIADVRRVIQEVQPLRHRREQAKLSSVVQAIAQLEGKLTEEVDFAEAEVMKAAGPIEMLGKYARHRPGLSDDDYDACRRQIEEHFGRWLLRDIDRGWIDTGSQNGQDTHETSDETTAHDDRPEAPDIGMPPTGETNEESDHGTLDETDATASRIGTSDPPASAVKDSLHDNETTIEDESQSIADEKTERIEEETNDLVDEHQQETATNAAENSSHPSESIISQVPTESLKEHSDLPPEGGTPQTTYNNEAAPSHPDSPHSFGRNLGTLPWRLLASDFPGLAYYASMAFETEGVDAEYPPAWLIRAATFGPFVDLSDDFKNMVQEDLSHFDAGDERHRATEFNLLLATATIAPALFAPNLTNAPSYLSHVEAPGGMEALNNCLHELKKYSSFRLPLDPSRLATDIYRIRDCDPLVVRASEWKRHALELTIKYQGATRIWKSWLRSDGPITRLIDAIIQNRQTEAEDISALVYTFGAPKEVAREIDALVKPTQEIIGQARQQLIAKAREAAELGEEWLAWLGSQSTSTAREDERLDELRASLTEYLPLAIEELKELVQAQPNSVAAIAGTLLADALGVMNARLFGSIDIPTDSVIAHFFGPITRLDIALDSDGRPRCSQPGQLLNVKEIIRKLLDAARLGLPSWEDAFQNFVKKEDHNSSQHLIDFARLSGKIEMAARFESEREQALSMSRRQLLERAKDTHLKLERSFAYGVIPAEERDRLRSLVSDIQRSSPALLRFDQHHSDLNAAEETIRAYNNRAINAVSTTTERVGIHTG